MPSQSSSTLLQVSVVGEPAITLHWMVLPSTVQTFVPVRLQAPTPTEHEAPRPG